MSAILFSCHCNKLFLKKLKSCALFSSCTSQLQCTMFSCLNLGLFPDSKVNGANMGPIWAIVWFITERNTIINHEKETVTVCSNIDTTTGSKCYFIRTKSMKYCTLQRSILCYPVNAGTWTIVFLHITYVRWQWISFVSWKHSILSRVVKTIARNMSLHQKMYKCVFLART